MKNLSKFNEDFIKEYDVNNNTRYFFEGDVVYPETLFNSHEDLRFLPESKINKKRALKQALNHGLKLKKVDRVIQF